MRSSTKKFNLNLTRLIRPFQAPTRQLSLRPSWGGVSEIRVLVLRHCSGFWPLVFPLHGQNQSSKCMSSKEQPRITIIGLLLVCLWLISDDIKETTTVSVWCEKCGVITIMCSPSCYYLLFKSPSCGYDFVDLYLFLQRCVVNLTGRSVKKIRQLSGGWFLSHFEVLEASIFMSINIPRFSLRIRRREEGDRQKKHNTKNPILMIILAKLECQHSDN